jgi:hypothetical protein
MAAAWASAVEEKIANASRRQGNSKRSGSFLRTKPFAPVENVSMKILSPTGCFEGVEGKA